jgi:putative transcriptional regulator
MGNNMPKKTRLFDDLMQGMQEMDTYLQGKRGKARVHHVPVVDVRKIRTKLGLSQNKFSERFGIPSATLRNWEQGRRQPETPTRILLAIIDRHPSLVDEVLGV